MTIKKSALGHLDWPCYGDDALPAIRLMPVDSFEHTARFNTHAVRSSG